MAKKPSLIRKSVWLILVVLLVAGCAGAVAAAETDTSAPAETLIETTDQAPPDDNTSQLSETTEATPPVTPTEAESDSTFQGDTRISVTVIPTGESFSSAETMMIYVGAIEAGDIPAPVSGEEITVTVERPDGTTDTLSSVTDDTGSAQVSYDLSTSNRGEGTYAVSATSPSTESEATVRPSVGTGITLGQRNRGSVLTGTETTVNFLIRDGTASVSGEPVDISVENPDGSVIDTRQVTSDADGFVEIPITPQQEGEYSIIAELQDTGARTTQDITARDVLFRSDFDLTQAVANEQSYYGGFLKDADGLVANEPVTVEIVNPDTDQVITEQTVTTDSSGMLSVAYNPGAADDLRATVTTSSGQTAVESDFINVERPQSTAGGAEITTEFTEFNVAPGEEARLQITATNAGEPLPDKEITVFPRLDFNGPPVEPQTVTTDTNGEANVTITAPPEAESGELDGAVYMRHNGEVIRDTIFTRIERYEVDFNVEDVAPGEETTLSVEATDRVTGDAASGINLQYNALSSSASGDSYATGALETGQSGADSESVTVPQDIEPDRAINYIGRYASTGLYRVNMYDFPGSLTVSTGETNDFGRSVAAPGDEVTLEFTTPGGGTAQGIAFARFEHRDDDSVDGSVIVPISSGEQTTLTVPDYAANDTFVAINVWSAESADQFYVAEQFIRVNAASNTGTDGGDGGDAGTGEIDVTGNGNPATDINGDGTLEDINGDGEFNIVDVNALFQNRNSNVVTENPEQFDFNGDGQFDIVDVSALFARL